MPLKALMTPLMKPLLVQRSPAGERGRLSILIFHRVLPVADALFPDEVDASRFDRICGWVRRWFHVMPLDAAAAALAEGRLPARAMAITFDDGYADNEAVALPILQRHGLTATFFVSTGYLDGGRMWNDTLIEAIRRSPLPELDLRDIAAGIGRVALHGAAARRAAIDSLLATIKYLQPGERLAACNGIARAAGVEPPDDLMMRSGQVRALRHAGMQIGAHTVSHPILARLPLAQAWDEITESRRHLESLLGEPVTLFAYPNGKPGEDYQPDNVRQVREAGFATAVSTAWGSGQRGSDRFQLPRFTPWDRSATRFGLRLWANLAR